MRIGRDRYPSFEGKTREQHDLNGTSSDNQENRKPALGSLALILGSRLVVNAGGERKTVTALEAIYSSMVELAVCGDTRAAALILRHAEQLGLLKQQEAAQNGVINIEIGYCEDPATIRREAKAAMFEQMKRHLPANTMAELTRKMEEEDAELKAFVKGEVPQMTSRDVPEKWDSDDF